MGSEQHVEACSGDLKTCPGGGGGGGGSTALAPNSSPHEDGRGLLQALLIKEYNVH